MENRHENYIYKKITKINIYSMKNEQGKTQYE